MFEVQSRKLLRNSEAQPKFTLSYKKKINVCIGIQEQIHKSFDVSLVLEDEHIKLFLSLTVYSPKPNKKIGIRN